MYFKIKRYYRLFLNSFIYIDNLEHYNTMDSNDESQKLKSPIKLKNVKKSIHIRDNRWSISKLYRCMDLDVIKPESKIIKQLNLMNNKNNRENDNHDLMIMLPKYAFNIEIKAFILSDIGELKVINLEHSVCESTLLDNIKSEFSLNSGTDNEKIEKIANAEKLIAFGDDGLVLQTQTSERNTVRFIKTKQYTISGQIQDGKKIIVFDFQNHIKRYMGDGVSIYVGFDFDIPCKYSNYDVFVRNSISKSGAFQFDPSTHASWLSDLYGVDGNLSPFLMVPPTLDQSKKLAMNVAQNMRKPIIAGTTIDEMSCGVDLTLIKKSKKSKKSDPFRYFFSQHRMTIPSNPFVKCADLGNDSDKVMEWDFKVELIQKNKGTIDEVSALLRIISKHMERENDVNLPEQKQQKKTQTMSQKIKNTVSIGGYGGDSEVETISPSSDTQSISDVQKDIEISNSNATREFISHKKSESIMGVELENTGRELLEDIVIKRERKDVSFVEYAKTDGLFLPLTLTKMQRLQLSTGCKRFHDDMIDDNAFSVGATLSGRSIKTKIFDQIVINVGDIERRQQLVYSIKTKAIIFDTMNFESRANELEYLNNDARLASVFDVESTFSKSLNNKEMSMFDQTGVTRIMDPSFRNIKSKTAGSNYEYAFEIGKPLDKSASNSSDDSVQSIGHSDKHVYGTNNYGTHTKSLELSVDCSEDRYFMIYFDKSTSTQIDNNENLKKKEKNTLSDKPNDLFRDLDNIIQDAGESKKCIKILKTLQCRANLLLGYDIKSAQSRNDQSRIQYDRDVGKRNGDVLGLLKKSEDNHNMDVIYTIFCGATSVKFIHPALESSEKDKSGDIIMDNFSQICKDKSDSEILELIPYIRYLVDHLRDSCYNFITTMQEDTGKKSGFNYNIGDNDLKHARRIINSNLFSNIVIAPIVTSKKPHGVTKTDKTVYDLSHYSIIINTVEEKVL